MNVINVFLRFSVIIFNKYEFITKNLSKNSKSIVIIKRKRQWRCWPDDELEREFWLVFLKKRHDIAIVRNARNERFTPLNNLKLNNSPQVVASKWIARGKTPFAGAWSEGWRDLTRAQERNVQVQYVPVQVQYVPVHVRTGNCTRTYS